MKGITLEDIDFERYLEETEAIAQKVQQATDFFDAAFARLSENASPTGDTLPWPKTWDKFRFRDGELTIWAGVNGNGKSLVMGQTALFFNKPCVIASMEMLPEATLARMIRQACGNENPTREYAERLTKKFHGKLWLYNQVGNVQQRALFGMIRYCARELGIKHVMIDSLVKCGLGVDDYNSQKAFVDQLTSLAKDESVHIHLVVHMRKLANEADLPDKHSIKGAGEITDLADNVIIVARRTINVDESSEDPTGFIRIAKHRHGDYEGTWGFWFHEPSQQWVSAPDRGCLPWPSLHEQEMLSG